MRQLLLIFSWFFVSIASEIGKYILITGNQYESLFVLPSLEDFYLTGKYANNYYNLNQNINVSNSVNLTSSSLGENNFTLSLKVVYKDATCYIKDYYGANYHKFCDNFENAVSYAQQKQSGMEVYILSSKVDVEKTIDIIKEKFNYKNDLINDSKKLTDKKRR